MHVVIKITSDFQSVISLQKVDLACPLVPSLASFDLSRNLTLDSLRIYLPANIGPPGSIVTSVLFARNERSLCFIEYLEREREDLTDKRILIRISNVQFSF